MQIIPKVDSFVILQLFQTNCRDSLDSRECSALQTQKESPIVLDMFTLSNGIESIRFDGNSNYLRKRRFWVLEKAGTITFIVVKADFSPGSFDHGPWIQYD